MASATLSALAGAILSPLRDVSLEKLIDYLWDHLSSSPSPSSSDEAEKQQQLKDSLEALEEAKLTVRLMQSRITKLFEKHKHNERVVGLHNKLKDVGYDIQDLESEMEYMELERKVEEINNADQEADTTTSRFSGKRLFPFRLPTAFLSKKKRRLPASSQSSSLSTDDDIVRQVTSIIKQINSIESKLKDEIKLEEWFDQIKLNGVYDPREQHHFTQNKRVTTSSTNERKIYGRDDEIRRLIEFLRGPNVDGNLSVVPIVGLGGMGKTALARSVFNDRQIENHFDKKAWIYVSDNFDRVRIIKEMVDIIIPTDQRCSTTSLDLLERELKRHLTGRKLLLVLDDVWSDEWQQLLSPLQSAQAIKIIVTCRDPKILGSVDKGDKIILEGLSDRDYWSLFVNYAFAKNNPDSYSQELHDIGKCIVGKLKGSPLAAIAVGKLLRRSLTEKHWRDVLESDLWKLETDAYDIMPALALSYYHLPQHLQLCFVFCSMLPKNYWYHMDDLICMWIANGYIHESGSSSKTMYDIGEEYYHELQQMCLFDRSYYDFLMHDLMRDLAQLVSHGEICIYESGKNKKISKNVRHLYVKDSIDLELVCETNNLRTLVLVRADDMSAFVSHEAFKRIRVLVINDANMQEFPDAICHLQHLQYLDLWETCIQSIPESLCRLYQLRVLKLPPPQILPSLFHNLINLQYWHMHRAHRKIFAEGTLIYNVERERGYVISQVRNMNKLRGALSIRALENINNMEEAMKSKLKEKRHIKKLGLHWNDRVDVCQHHIQEEVVEGLQPHPNLKELLIDGYMGSKMPKWLMTLQKLKKIELVHCRNWACLPAALGLLPSLQRLYLYDIENITVECDDSVTEMYSSLERLELSSATVSFKGMSSSSLSSSSSSLSSSSSSLTTSGGCRFFPRLQYLRLSSCDGVNGSHWLMSSALKQLYIMYSPGLDDQLPGCLYGLSSLTRLELCRAKIKTFPTEVMATLHALENLRLAGDDRIA
ncbi:P-loop containing nucleoside triphosphate hydrolase protein [Dioscorea alata]|uniref:P-loop containing nucleoside triphosphate hydrolase protein n=4 Tax=Dioscorea alata TaxID=55571 RepID=A0ACB7WLV3_DIOAL|nr:P-loop containing nucleoside triphosphate hydrolase protein [Dioscorea alata]KAH7688904.1 P-loop containing nucleoside triphosphate hydrolase protein [Dioscorea alata]KAH7688905.1 P-loop containing nucleoside triphosphate hydrolase protein [Dioscorea alata]KAH7688906.1 P-loop containing nucleoside triphosphate hydrolase protein [Dioscorea alata]